MPKAAKPQNPEPAQTQAPTAGLVRVRLKPNSPYGRVMVGLVVIERVKPPHGWPMIPAKEFERLAEEYGLEAVEE
jgi:hypothetical protein